MTDRTAKIAEFARTAAVRACRAAGVGVADDASAYDIGRAVAAADGYAVAIGGRGVPTPATLALRCAIQAAEEASLIVDDIAELGAAAERYIRKRAVTAETAALRAEAHAAGAAYSANDTKAAQRDADAALVAYLA